MPETAAFNASRDAQQALQRRVDALTGGIAQALADVAARLGSLPPAASFEPFAQVAASPGVPAQESANGEAAPPRARRPVRGERPVRAHPAAAGALARVGALAGAAASGALAAPQQPVPGGRSSSMALPSRGEVAPKSAAASGAPLASTATAAPPATGAAAGVGLLAALMQEIDAQAAQPMALGLGQTLARGIGAGLGTALAGSAGGLGQALAAATGRSTRGAPSVPVQAGLGSWAQQVLEATSVLSRPAPPLAPAADKSAGAARSLPPAQRAESRLLPPARTAAEALRGEAPTHPSAAPADNDPDAFSHSLQRALLDQAWLRGVDLR